MKTLNDSLYPAIFTRKSTRGYSDVPVAEDKLNRLRMFMQEAVPLLSSEQAAFEIQPHKGNTMKIAAYANSDAASLLNMAFMLQQMDLFIQANEMGALWNATIRATVKEHKGLSYKISLVFGMAGENSIRTSVSQFVRKQSVEIANKPELPFIEAVRLAPSARNRQPWYLACTDGRIDFYSRKGSFIDNTLLKNLHWFDLGIAVCHTVLALQQQGFSPTAVMRTDAAGKEGYLYGISLDY